MPSPSYRRLFLVACGVIGVLAAAVALLAWRLHRRAPLDGAAGPTATVQDRQPTEAHPGGPPAGRAPGDSSVPPLPPMQWSPQRLQSIGVRIGRVESRVVGDELRVAGSVETNERRVAYVQSRVAGWIREVSVGATGDRVRQGQTLFTIDSPDVVTTEREYLLAKKNVSGLERSAVPGVAAGAASLLNAARDRLLQWQIPPAELARLDASGTVSHAIAIESPTDGYVIEKRALPNLYVQPDTRLYTIADLSDVWVIAQVFQNDAGRIRPGQRAEVTVDAYPGRTFAGRVDYVLPHLDAATRTLPVRLVFPNPGLELRPGMYVNVTIRQSLGRHLVVPASAIFHSGTQSLVFVYEGEGRITPTVVDVGARAGDDQIVLRGVDAGDQIVTSANFLIDSEAQLQAATGAFEPPAPGASGAAVMAPRAPRATVEMTTDPSPPRKGANTVRVRLASADGRGVAGARVTVTFAMPAMPAMGMGAMRTVVTAADKGGGLYEGSGVLGSGGTWQVTITATRDGQTVATEEQSVTATGGM
jgi:Cu(I)/Ag(I) efflux system membrane fusion protein/cobalt-zinc-cadmium efflux system membrane fusion protein